MATKADVLSALSAPRQDGASRATGLGARVFPFPSATSPAQTDKWPPAATLAFILGASGLSWVILIAAAAYVAKSLAGL